jgi:uncharacterized protein (DUF433 family)
VTASGLPTPQILALCDAGHTPAQIAAAVPSATLAQIYAILRAERPSRKRAPRRRTSAIPAQVVALDAAGVKVARIAGLLGCSRAYVHRILAEQEGA